MLALPHLRSPATRWLIAALSLAPVVGNGVLAQATAQAPRADREAPPRTEEIDSLAHAALEAFGVPGFALGVIEDGEVVLARGYGERTRGGGESVDSATLFAIASNTKAFIGTAVAILADEGALRLEDPVRAYLPYLAWRDSAITRLAIVEDLLTHRTGLGTFEGDHLWFRRDLPAREVLASVRYLPLRYPFRAGYGYSNLMFIAAGEVIEAATGTRWDATLSERIFSPLGMARTVTSVSQLPADNVASGHVTRQGNRALAAVPWEASGAAGGVWSSASDMLRWLECNLDRGVFRGDTIWSEAVQANAWRPRNPLGSIDNFASYALGWSCYTRAGHGVVGHGGGYDGMYSRVVAVPDLRLGIVVLSNSMTDLPATLANRIRDAYLGVDTAAAWLTDAVAGGLRGDSVWTSRQDSVALRLAAVAGQPDAIGLAAGTYRDPVYGDFTVGGNATQGYTLAFPHAEGLAAKLAPVGGDRYRLTWDDPSAWFDRGLAYVERDREGREVLRLYVPNDDIFFDGVEAVRLRTR